MIYVLYVELENLYTKKHSKSTWPLLQNTYIEML